MAKPTYSELLKDPRWQQKRLEIMSRDGFTCLCCGDKTHTLHVHHRYYISGRMPWEYPDFCFQTLCNDCHDSVPVMLSESRENGNCVFEDWEAGLDYFGDKLFDMWAEESISKRNLPV